MIFTKSKEGVWAIPAMKYKNYVTGKYTRARAPLARKYTKRIVESKDGTTSMKVVNYIERHNFCWNDLLTKSNRAEIQTYKVEERTFGTPCRFAKQQLYTCITLFLDISLPSLQAYDVKVPHVLSSTGAKDNIFLFLFQNFADTALRRGAYLGGLKLCPSVKLFIMTQKNTYSIDIDIITRTAILVLSSIITFHCTFKFNFRRFLTDGRRNACKERFNNYNRWSDNALRMW